MKNVSILIIEDEKAERESIIHCLTSKLNIPLNHIYPSDNSIDAYTIYKTYPIDVVLCDINIPGGEDGIQLIKRMKQLYDSCFMIITSYGYFEYIQSAIHLGIKNFLLKPVKEKVLIENVTQLIDTSTSKQIHEENRSLLIKKMSLMMPLMKHNLFYSILQNANLYEIMNNMDLLGWKCEYGMCIVIKESYDHEAMMLLDILQKSMPHLHYLYDGFYQYFVLFLMKEEAFKDDELKSICLDIEMIFKDAQSIGIGGWTYGLDRLNYLYARSVHMINQENDYGYIQNKDSMLLNEEVFFKMVIEYIYMNEEDKLIELLNRYIYELIMIYPKEEINDHLQSFIQYVQKENLLNEIDDKPWLKHHEGEYTYDELKELFHKWINRMKRNIPQKGNKNRKKIIENAIEYISDHYTKQISLKDVAKHLSLSPIYVSRIIKEETNKSFTEILTLYRMDQAKKLLKQQVRIKEVANATGFLDVNYFSKVFKKICGMTPKEYSQKESSD